MNSRQKEVQQQYLNNEKAVLKKLEQNYKDALGEINSKIEILMSRQDADMQHVIYQVEYQKAMKKQVEAILETLLSTGCRVSELAQITKTDIEGGRVLIHGKGQKDRFVYLNAKAMLAIEKYLEKRKDKNQYLFPGSIAILKSTSHLSPKNKHEWWTMRENVMSNGHIEKGTIENIMRRLAVRAGVKKANPHKLRRTCATMALRRGMPTEQVSSSIPFEFWESALLVHALKSHFHNIIEVAFEPSEPLPYLLYQYKSEQLPAFHPHNSIGVANQYICYDMRL